MADPGAGKEGQSSLQKLDGCLDTSSSEEPDSNIADEDAESPYYQDWKQLESNLRNLCLQLWPQFHYLFGNNIEYLSHGRHNVNAALSIPNPSKATISTRSNYVIRISKSKDGARNYVAVSKYLQKALGFPIPQVLFYDLTTNNAIRYPYVITNRITGMSLSRAIKNGITHQQMLCVAKDLGRFYKEMLSIKSNRAGLILATDAGSLDLDTSARILPFGSHQDEPIKEYDCSSEETSSCPFTVYEAPDTPCATTMHKAVLLGVCRDSDDFQSYERSFWKQINSIYGEMKDMGLFSDNTICLSRGSLSPSNIMVDTFGSVTIVTGILGWNETFFSPRFMANQPPTFLWAPVASESRMSDFDLLEAELETFGGLTVAPLKPEMAELKQVFEKHAGEGYTSKPFTKEAFLADRLLQATFLECDEFLFFTVILKKYFDAWQGLRSPPIQVDEDTRNKATDDAAMDDAANDVLTGPSTSKPKKLSIKLVKKSHVATDGQGDGPAV